MGAVYDVWAWIVLAGNGAVPAWIIVTSVGTGKGSAADPLAAVLTELGSLIVSAIVEGGRGSLAAWEIIASDEFGWY